MFDWLLEEGATWQDFWTDPFWKWIVAAGLAPVLLGLILIGRKKLKSFLGFVRNIKRGKL